MSDYEDIDEYDDDNEYLKENDEDENNINEQLEIMYNDAKNLSNPIEKYEEIISLETENSPERKWSYQSYKEICKIAIQKNQLNEFTKYFLKLRDIYDKVDYPYQSNTLKEFVEQMDPHNTTIYESYFRFLLNNSMKMKNFYNELKDFLINNKQFVYNFKDLKDSFQFGNLTTQFNELKVKLNAFNLSSKEIELKNKMDLFFSLKVRERITIVKETVQSYKNKEPKDFWYLWISDYEKFSELPSFFSSSSSLNDDKCVIISFYLFIQQYDYPKSIIDIGYQSSKYIYEILSNIFYQNKNVELRSFVVENGIFNYILKRLGTLTKEKERIYKPGKEENDTIPIKKKEEDHFKMFTYSGINKGVGYGSNYTHDNREWNVNEYLERKKHKSFLNLSILKFLTGFFNFNNFSQVENIAKVILESCLLPCIESELRGGVLSELVSKTDLFLQYLELIKMISRNSYLYNLLLKISPDYKPVQTQSIFDLLNNLKDTANIFLNCLKNDKSEKIEKSEERTLAIEISNSYNEISENIKAFQSNVKSQKTKIDITKLPLEKAYPLLLHQLSFGYTSNIKSKSTLRSFTFSQNSSKSIRLAQEFADLQNSLPVESTNAIFVRVDKDDMDFMKVLIIGSEGTPYSNGAFVFDVAFDSNYPNNPPHVVILTTGGGSVRFNPNLYSTGKVCLSLLGTWRGVSTENWDPKISTLFQVLISIQSIIMSDLVYFNEPSCESEIGTVEGNKKNEGYANIVRYGNVKFAMIDQIENPTPGFEDVIKRHFFLKKNQILKEVEGWIERGKNEPCSYTSYVSSHNNNISNRFSSAKNNYSNEMSTLYVKLKNLLNNITLPDNIIMRETIEYESSFNPELNLINTNNNLNSNNLDKENLKQKQINDDKMEIEKMNKIDMSYDDNNKNMNNKKEINDNVIKDRWSRYIGAMGIESVKKQSNANVFLSGAGGLGIEIAKNIILSGCKEFVIHDTKNVNSFDLSSQFYLSKNDIGKNRAQCSVNKLQSLNYYVKVSCNTEEFSNINLEKIFNDNKFNVIILTESDCQTINLINNYCRSKNISFICSDIYGYVGRCINDFGNNFIVNDINGEDPKECFIKKINIINNNEASAFVIDGIKHNFSDDDIVSVYNITDQKLNVNEEYKIKFVSNIEFKLIGDVSKAKKLFENSKEGNLICKELKQKKIIKFSPIQDLLNINSKNYKEITEKYLDKNLQHSDWEKSQNNAIINLSMNLISKLRPVFPKEKPYNQDILDLLNQIIEKDFNPPLNNKEKEILLTIGKTYIFQFPTLCAFFGGIIAQEAIKSITGKFVPINQIFIYDTLELSSNNINISNIKLENDRSDSLKYLLSQSTYEKLKNLKTLIVGAGAIGCELIKNFSMLDIGINGKIYITDPDIIEVSNLTRQFLFREKHLRLPKSSTASAAAIQMNPKLKNHIFPKTLKLSEETKDYFNDEFISSLDIITNALDNINARKYVDSRCVTNRIPLLESGTLGSKGHVQVIIPFKTESYSSLNDPDNSNDEIPQCTLKMFPEDNIHCVEWAKDYFGKIFYQLPLTIIKVCNCVMKNENNFTFREIKKSVKWIKKMPKNFIDCLIIARRKFNKIFIDNIMQLLYLYPPDKIDSNGKLFWSLPKRQPSIYEYNKDDNLCIDFISAYSCLIAEMFDIEIPYKNPRDEKCKKDMINKLEKEKITFENIIPDKNKMEKMKNEVEKEQNKNNNNTKINEDNNSSNTNNINEEENYIKELKKLNISNINNLKSVEFEKDNDSNFQIDLIYSMSALRCKNYKIEPMDWITVKLKAGKIIPALSTTTSSIAALQTIELVKIISGLNVSQNRNSFLNLALPYLQCAEPGMCQQKKITDKLSSNLWDRWDIILSIGNDTIKNLFDILFNKYGIWGKDIFLGKKLIFSSLMYKDKVLKDKKMNEYLSNLLGINKKVQNYCDVLITFTLGVDDNNYLNNIPTIRLIFN